MGNQTVSRPNSLTKDSIFLTGGLGIAQVLSAVTFVLAARLLGPGSYGQVAAIYGIALFTAAVLDFGAATQAMRALARDSCSPAFLRVAPSRAWLTVALIVVGAGGLIIRTTPTACLVPVAAASIAFEQFACSPSRAKAHFRWVSTVLIVDKATAIVIFLALQGSQRIDNGLALMFALSIGPMVGTCLALKDWGELRSSLSHLPRSSPWEGSGHFGVGGLAIGIQSLDIQLVGWSAGPAVAGTYAAVSKWGAPVTLLASGVSQAAFPAMAKANDRGEAHATFRAARRALIFPIIGLGLLAAGARYLVPLILGDAYIGSVVTLRILAIALVLVCLSQPLIAFLQARGHERSTGRILVLGTATQFGALVLLVPVWGATGAAAAATLAQLVICALAWRSMARSGAKEMAKIG